MRGSIEMKRGVEFEVKEMVYQAATSAILVEDSSG